MDKELLDKIVKNVEVIELGFTDMFGSTKSIEIPSECLEDAVKNGVWFDGSSIKGFARIMESDMYLKPDLSTFAIVPGDLNRTGRFFCDIFTPEGELFEGDPRAVLKKAINGAKSMGYTFKVGPEVEFYLFKRKDNSFSIPCSDGGSYFDSPVGDIGSEIRKKIMASLKSYGINSERAHHEVGNGQHEIGFRYDDALVTADRAVILKREIKTIANSHGLVASFMPKPLFAKPGNGMHVHFSLFDSSGNPLFYDENDPHKLSKLAKNFIAGQLNFIKEMSAITNPTVNSYKRLVSGYEAPVYICWGSKNRSALVRVPRYTHGKPASVRGELRCPDPSASPYLVFAAMLKAGLEGVKRDLELMVENEDNAFDNNSSLDVLPSSLSEAIEYFNKSTIMEELLGQKFFMKYSSAKQKECEDFKIAVTDWEKDRYLEKC